MNLGSYWPTQEERTFFEQEGYLIVPDALSPAQVQSLSSTIDHHGSSEDKCREGQYYNRLDILGLDDAFLDLVDNPPVLAKVSGFLGWNIWVNHTHYNVRPPDASAEGYRYGWHVDGGVFSTDLQYQAPMTAIKVGFYLTDLTRPEHGQTYILRGSHLDHSSRWDALGARTPPLNGAVPLEVKAGSAVLFQQRAFHSHGSPNLSSTTRKAVFVQWAYRWLFPVDTMTLGDLESRLKDAIRRQMLGFDPERPSGRLSARYYPHLKDLPLKSRLIQDVGIMRLCELGPAATRNVTRFLNFDLE